MDTSKIIRGVVSNGRYTVTAPIIKEDYGLYLKIEGVELPSTYEVDFSNSESSGTSVTMIGNADGVLIPHQFIETGKDVFAFLYHVGEDFGRTVYKFRIPNKVRPDRTNEQPTPEEQSVIDQTISALNEAVEQTQDAQQAIENMSVSAQTLAEGESATVTKTESEGVVHLEFGIPKGQTGDSPTITASKTGKTTSIYVDGSEIAQIEDGTDGTNGDDGYSPTANVSKTGKVATITITDKNGTTSAQVEDGEDGATGATPNLTIGTVETLESTESATASITGTPENPVLNLGIPQGEQGEVTLEDYYKAFPTDTASGAVASFTDGADDLPLKSLAVDIDPVQDLHGYDSPWVGGAGVNKWDELTESGSINTTTGENIANSAIIRTASYIPVVAGNTYKFVTTDQMWVFFYDSEKTLITSGLPSGAGSANNARNFRNGYTVLIPENCAYIRWYFRSEYGNTYKNDTALNYPSTVTTYSPYENICPISGWTQVNVNHSDADMTNPTTITIDLGQTVYGGKLDVLSGVMTVDMAMVDLGTLNWSKGSNNVFYAPYSVNPQRSSNAKGYPYISSMWAYGPDINAIWSGGTNGLAVEPNGISSTPRIYAYHSVYASMTKDEFKTAMNGVQVCHELAEPIEIQLDGHALNSLYGVNNIFTDTGDTTAEYRADPTLYISRLTEPDSDMIADSNITSGQYFMVGNSLFKATANIANGSAVVVGTNATRKSLSEALNEINA